MTDLRKDKFRGVLLGMACGDALGAQIEFTARDSKPWQSEMTGKGPHRLKPGQWTDDTAMALILAEHLESDPTLGNANALASGWIDWYRDGKGSCTGRCFDIGGQTAASLRHWEDYGYRPMHDEAKRGNGALMRVAPVALVHYDRRFEAQNIAFAQATITHGQACGNLCSKFVAILDVMMNTGSPSTALTVLAEAYPEIAKRPRDEVDSSGYDVATFEAAIWAVLGAEDAGDAIRRAANLGDDADTVGAVAGALAGAVWGTTGLPAAWLKALAWGDRICGMADRMYERTV